MSLPLLYDFALDDECYKVRLVLGILGIAHDTHPVDVIPGRAQQGPELLRLNPLGRLPILVDGLTILRDPHSIAAYLAIAHDPARTWLPADPAGFGATMDWVCFAARDLDAARAARAAALLTDAPPPPALVAAALRALTLMEDHMVHRGFAGGSWFATDHPTIADLALFPGFALSRDYGVDHEAFPALRRWARLVRGLAGFRTMPGIAEYF